VNPPPDSSLADPQQIIANLQRELAQAKAERDEAQQREVATSEVLGVINSSPGDLDPVFDAILEQAMDLCTASFGIMWAVEQGEGRTLATRGVPEAFAAFRKSNLVLPGQPGITAQVNSGEPFVHIVDLKDDDVYRTGDPQRRAVVDLGGARTYLVVPLRKGEVLLGGIDIYRQEVRPFIDKQIALLQNFAAQAVIAIENARLLTETREALEQQTATAEILQVINSSPGDLTPVFEAILKKAHDLCGVASGVLMIRDGEEFRISAVHGEPRFVEVCQQVGPVRAFEGGATLPLLRGTPIVHVTDARTHDSYRLAPPNIRRLYDVSRARTVLWVPLRKDDVLLGVITASRQEVRPFTGKQIALLQNFASQAVIAMENARLITETREALDQQTATAEVLGVINSSPGDLRPVFDAMLEKAMHLCGASFGILRTRDGALFHTVAAHGVPAPYGDFLIHNPQLPAAGTSGARMLGGEPAVHIVDLAATAHYRAGKAHVRALVELGGARTALTVPLTKEGSILGAFQIYRQEIRPFTDKQIALLQNFASQAVIAMENARLLGDLRERTSDLTEALEQQTATAELLGVINTSPGDLLPVFDAMLEKALHRCNASFGHIVTCDGECFQTVVAHGEPLSAEWNKYLGVPFQTPPAGPLGRILGGEDISQVTDMAATDAFRGNEIARWMVETAGARTVLAIALRQADALLGAIMIYRQEVRPFTDKQIALLQNFAAQAVIAMENARLLGELRQRTDEVAELNRGLEARVAEQVEELGRVGRLRRFLAPQLAELIVSQGDENILESHRREIVVVFCDLRGSTAFTETAEPEEALEFLRQYHGALGPLVSQFEGTLDHFAGDGIMVFFNDPVPCPDPAERAVKMAVAMREAAGELITAWRRHGSELGFGVGIAQGYATLGQIGFSDHSGYTAIGTVCNLASRLCAEAKDGQILVSSRIAEAVEAVVKLENLGNLDIKGLRRPVATFNVAQG
jgi:class 3 adenylate cyclase